MKKEDLLNSEFLKQFKNWEELNAFLHELQKRGVEQQLLEGEMDAHLGYNKNQQSDNHNYRNEPVAELFTEQFIWDLDVLWSLRDLNLL